MGEKRERKKLHARKNLIIVHNAEPISDVCHVLYAARGCSEGW